MYTQWWNCLTTHFSECRSLSLSGAWLYCNLVLNLSQGMCKEWFDSCPELCSSSMWYVPSRICLTFCCWFSPFPLPLGPSHITNSLHLYCSWSLLSNPSLYKEISSTGELRYSCTKYLRWLSHCLQQLWLLGLALQTPYFGSKESLKHPVHIYPHGATFDVRPSMGVPWTFRFLRLCSYCSWSPTTSVLPSKPHLLPSQHLSSLQCLPVDLIVLFCTYHFEPLL